MKNVRPEILKTCICLDVYEFKSTLYNLFNKHINIDFSYDGLNVCYASDEDRDIMATVLEKLAEHFDVAQITSIHIDDCEEVGIWIVYIGKTP